jgi:ubiquinone/menaquinone biosynthesis C-methylase UbiE
MERQHELVKGRFSEQAARWAEMEVPRDLQEILARIELPPEARVLDVAAGTALLGRALSVRAGSIVAIDITPAMLERGRDVARQQGIENIEFVEGAAEAMPFADGSFDLSITRFSLHHIADPNAVAGEMVRVVRGRGKVAIIDMIASDDPTLAARSNAIERKRDASHARTLGFSELQRMLASHGAALVDAYTVERIREFDDWVELSGAEVKDELRAFFERELAGGEPTGLRAFKDGDKLCFHHPLGVVIARA